MLELSLLKHVKNSGVIISMMHWILQIVVLCIVFAVLRYQLLNYAFIAYEEHFKKLWLSFFAVMALSGFSIASNALVLN